MKSHARVRVSQGDWIMNLLTSKKFAFVVFVIMLACLGAYGSESGSTKNLSPFFLPRRHVRSWTVIHTVTVVADFGLVSSSVVKVRDGTSIPITATAVVGYLVVGAVPSGITGKFSNGTFVPDPVKSDGSVHFVGGSVGDGFRLNQITVNHQVLRASQFSTIPFQVTISTYGSKAASVTLNYFTAELDGSLPSDIKSIPMNDSGMSGGEHIFSLTFPTGMNPLTPLRFYNGWVDAVIYFVNVYDSSGNVLSDSGGVSLEGSYGVLDPIFKLGMVEDGFADNVVVSQVNPLDATVFATSHVVNVVDPSCALDPMTVAGSALSKYYPEVFDGVVAITSGCTRIVSNGTFGSSVNNQVSGIGVPVSPTPSISPLYSEAWMGMDDPLLLELPHESLLGHGRTFYLNNSALNLTDSLRAHISGFSSLQGVVQYGQFLVQQPDGNWLVTAQSNGKQPYCRHFAKLECYLNSGNCPPSDVPPLYIALGDTSKYYAGMEIPASEITKVTIEDIIRVYGQRSPSTGTNLQLALVVVTPIPATEGEMAFFEAISEYYSENWESVIDSRGIFDECTPPSLAVAMDGAVSVNTTLPSHK
jgi:hypothetical protein